jgi:hypothetical protein
MGDSQITIIAFLSCLLGLGVGWYLLRWSKREIAALAGERQTILKRRLGLWGRRANARALFAGGIAILYFSVIALFTLLTRR